MSTIRSPAPVLMKKLAKRAPIVRGAPHSHASKAGQALIRKLQTALKDQKTGSFSLSFQEVGKNPGWRSSVVGVTAVDKLIHGVTGGRAMKAYTMVRITGSGLKSNPQGVPTKRVPAYGVKPIVVRSLHDIEAFLKHGPIEARAAWAARHHPRT